MLFFLKDSLEIFLESPKPQKTKNFRAVFCSIFVLFALYFYSKTIFASFMYMIWKYCSPAMLLDKNWNHTRKEKVWNLSIFNLYFLAKFCKRDWGDLQETTAAKSSFQII